VVHEFRYAVQTLPPGRLPFHRWRWELWQDAWMLAAGWCTAPADAHGALLKAASRRVHELRGVRALRPDRVRPLDALRPGRPVRIDTGAGLCLLVPLEAGDRAVAAAS
jgi:hypothetical protein